MNASNLTSQEPKPKSSKEQNGKNSPRKYSAKQLVAIIGAIAAVSGVVFTTWEGQITINHNTQTTLRQAEDIQLSTAITALGSSQPAERVAGLLLLTRNTADRFALSPETGEPPSEVYGDYTTALQILSGYLSSQSHALIGNGAGGTKKTFGLGYGTPPPAGFPLDITYAADQVELLLDRSMESKVLSLHDGRPRIDLSYDELYGQPWSGINFRWISGWLPGIDLRGASLDSSQWSRGSNLSHSFLQCANLQNANFRGANLTDAHLNGAYVQGANFRNARIRNIQLKYVYGHAKWPRWRKVDSLSATKWHQDACLSDSHYWVYPPTLGSRPTPSQSPRTKSSPSPGPRSSSGK
jgi:hypothetical protein